MEILKLIYGLTSCTGLLFSGIKMLISLLKFIENELSIKYVFIYLIGFIVLMII